MTEWRRVRKGEKETQERGGMKEGAKESDRKWKKERLEKRMKEKKRRMTE